MSRGRRRIARGWRRAAAATGGPGIGDDLVGGAAPDCPERRRYRARPSFGSVR